MIQVYLDGQRLDTPQDLAVGVTVSIADIEDVATTVGSFSNTVDIPVTDNNRRVFMHADEALSTTRFNAEEHRASIVVGGVTLIEGKAYIEKSTISNGGSFSLQIVGGEFDWVAKIKDKKMNEISSDKSLMEFGRYSTVKQSIDAEKVKRCFFALVEHGGWWAEMSDAEADNQSDDSDDKLVRRSWATYNDLVPFVSLKHLLAVLFDGYTVDYVTQGAWSFDMSDFYVTGAYKEDDDVDIVEEQNDFLITYNFRYEGTEYSRALIKSGETPLLPGWDTIEEDDNNRVEIISAGRGIENITFNPSRDDVKVAFLLKVRMRSTLDWCLQSMPIGGTAYKVCPFELPLFGDEVRFHNREETVCAFDITDSIEWKNKTRLTYEGRGSFGASYPYTLQTEAELLEIQNDSDGVFAQAGLFALDLPNAELFSAVGFLVTATFSGYNQQEGGEFARVINLTCRTNYLPGVAGTRRILLRGFVQNYTGKDEDGLNVTNKFIRCDIFVQRRSNNHIWRLRETGTFEDVTSNFDKEALGYRATLYYLSDAQSLTFNADVITPTLRVSPQTETLDRCSIATFVDCSRISEHPDGETNSNLYVTPLEGCELSPKFKGIQAVSGEGLSVNDVGGDGLATDFIKAIAQLFNLRYLTNPDSKRITVIPGDAFYTGDVVDWRGRIDETKEITVADLVDSVGTGFQLRFDDSGEPTSEYNKYVTMPLGGYDFSAFKTSVLSEPMESKNAIFNAALFVDAKKVFDAQTTSVQMLRLCTEDEQTAASEVEPGDWPRTIVTVVKDDSGEFVTDTLRTNRILDNYVQPRLDFTGANGGSPVAFSELGQVSPDLYVGGRYIHYQRQANIYREGRRITCYCRLEAQEVEALRKYSMHPTLNFRSRYMLRINGEDVPCRLESVEFETSNASHKCQFITSKFA